MKNNNLINKNSLFKYMSVLAVIGLLLISIGALSAKTVKGGKKISSELFGLFFEDINYAADGGLYAELVQNRSFEYNPAEKKEWHPFSFWEFITPGFSIGYISVETRNPVHSNNPHYIVLDVEFVGNYEQYKGEAGVGIKNSGFDGMVIRKGENYNFSMFAHLLSDEPLEFLLNLQKPNGEVIATNKIDVVSKTWLKIAATLTATADCDSASLVLLAKKSGKIAIDMVSLFPKNTFKNRENGLRKDLAQTLADLSPKFVRFPGGCLVHGNGLGNMYRWKNTIGPIETRKEQRNIWGYNQSAGLGYFEYFQFCEDIGAKPIPILPAAVSCQNSGGTHVIGGAGQKALCIDDMQEYIQEVLDLIEWANGSVTSQWGAKRKAAGHLESFNLEYIGIGNEDKMTPEFEERFGLIYKAVKEKHPEITIIGTSGPFHSGPDFEKGWEIANQLKVPIIDEHYYAQPEWLLSNLQRYDAYDRKGGEVYLGEYASWGNKLWNAIAEAAYMISLERNGDIVRMASYAPMLAKKGFTQWTTDMIFFDNINIVPTPNYYVQKMFMNNQGDYYFDKVFAINKNDTTLAASCVLNSQLGDIILKMVNAGAEKSTLNINLSHFKNIEFEAQLTVLTGNANDINTFENAQNITPVESEIEVSMKFNYDLPAMSMTVIRIKSK
ncbi:MAG TPA: alpha-L-arabinofuranosidase C-terminal domain-containing protein [Prolixibacteraceae bacterium]|nr:alpha-L-arabinofuranosidase C-terminal domain-containing protein [Prolixibacteraceae bacterium]